MRGIRVAATLVTASLASGVPSRAAAQEGGRAATTEIIASAAIPWDRYADAVTRVYALNAGAALWLNGSRVSRPGHAALQVLVDAGQHGLDPRNYGAAVLDSLAHLPLQGIERDRFDARLTVGLICFLDDLRFGRLHPATLDRSGADTTIDLARGIYDAISADSIPGLVAATAPRLAQYRNLQRLLVRYRELAADRTTDRLQPYARMAVGEKYAEAAALRWKLARTGDLEPGVADLGSRYSAADSAAVWRFQIRHGLVANGSLDSTTAAELNTPFAWRVRQIELAMERLRWLPTIGSRPFVVVNIPAFQLFAFDSAGGTGAPSLSMRVIVGNALDTRTPVLFELMRYVEFRPYWYAPLSIVDKEILPLLQKDPEYLVRNQMEVVDQRNTIVAATLPGITEQISRGTLRIRQRPGSSNPLGLVKFVFPNADAIYLHGTPRAELFQRTRRDLSHGCLRVEDPTTLAAWVLRDRPRWNRAAIVTAQRGSTTVRASLTRPMPVVIWYTTAVATPDGKAWFYADIYDHDRQLDQAMRAVALTASVSRQHSISR